MQHTALRSMGDVARAIALPGESAPVRFPSFPALERTSVLRFNTPASWTLGPGTTRAMLMRQPTYPLWLEQNPGAGSSPYSYTCGWISDGRTVNDVQMDVYTGMTYAYSGNNDGSMTVPRILSTSIPPSSFPVIGQDTRNGPTPFIWVPAKSYAIISVIPVTVSPEVTTVCVNGQVWGPGSEYGGTTSFINFTANSKGSVVELSGPSYNTGYWWRPMNIGLDPGSPTGFSACNVFLTVICGASGYSTAHNSTTAMPQITSSAIDTSRYCMLPVGPPAEFTNSTIPYNSTRCTAAAALFTNTTKVLNKEGTVQWGRLNPERSDVWNFDATTLQTLHPSEKAFLGLENGTYAYVPPSTDQANFWDHSFTVRQPQIWGSASGTFTTVPIYRLDNTALVACAAFVDPDGATNLAVNLDWHIEFRNVSALFPVGLSSMTLEAFHQAQLALVMAGFFYQNENHRSILSRVLSFVKQIAPKLLAAHPVGAAGLAAYRELRRKNRRPSTKKGKKRKNKGAPAATGQPQKLKSGLDMFLNSRSVLKPQAAPHRPATTSGRKSGFR